MLRIYIAIAVGVMVLSGAFTAGWRINGWRIASQEAKAADFAQQAGESATKAAVAAIAALKPKYTTINKAVERETRTEVRYNDAACQHTAGTWGLLDQAYQAAGGQPFDNRAGVPAPAPAAGP